MSDALEKRKLILLSRLKKRWDEPNIGLWEQYLHLFDEGVKEAQISTYKFDKIGELISRRSFDGGPSLLSEDQRAAVEGVLKTLTPTQQKILHLTYWRGLSVRQIAKILGLPRSTVNRWKYDAIKEMKQKSGTNY